MPPDPQVLAFIARQRESADRAEREANASLRTASLEERGRMIEALCRLAMQQAEASPQGERMRKWTEPPHPSYADAITRIRRENPGWVFRMPERTDADDRGEENEG